MIKNIKIIGDRTVYNTNIMLNPDDRFSYCLKIPRRAPVIKIDALRADGVTVSDIAETGSGDYFNYVLKSNMYSAAGSLEIRIAHCGAGGSVLTTQYVYFSVCEGAGAGQAAEDTGLLASDIAKMHVDMNSHIGNTDIHFTDGEKSAMSNDIAMLYKNISALHEGKLDCKICTDGNIDGYINDGLYYIDVDNEEYHDENTGISVVTPTEPFYLFVSRRDTTEQYGSWHIAQHRVKEGVIQRRYGSAALIPPSIPIIPAEPVEGEITEIELFSDEATVFENSSSITVSWGTWENYLTDADVEKLLDEYQTKLAFDPEPTEESANAITSGGVWKAISDLKNYVNDYVGMLNATLEARLDGGE